MATKAKAATLYDLTDELRGMMEDIEMWMEDNEGDLTGYPFERLDKLEGEVKDKVLKCAVMYKDWKAQGAAIKGEEQTLAKRRAAHENRGERMKKYMESCLPANAKFEDARACVSWKKNPAAVEVLVPVDTLPELFLRRADPEADKAELKARMVEFEIDLKDDLGDPLFDTEGKPLKAVELQVRWPKPVVVDEEDLTFAEAPVAPDYIVLARMRQGKSLLIK